MPGQAAPAVLPHRYQIVKVGDVSPHPANPNRGDVEAIADSIGTVGFYGVLLVHQATGHILAGEHRWRAARQRGLGELPAIVIDCGEDVARKIMLGDNAYARAATWDSAKLVALLQEMQMRPDGLAGSGFDAADLARMLNRWGGGGELPEPPGEPVTRPGDVWACGPHRLVCGDATDPAVIAAACAGTRPRLLLSDPPYQVGYDGGAHADNRLNKAMIPGRPFDSADPGLYAGFLEAAAPALAASAVVYQWHAALHADRVLQAWRAAGLHAHQVLYWCKGEGVQALGRSDFGWNTEACLYGWAGTRPDRRRRPPPAARNVWHLPAAFANDAHPTAKPVRLWADPMSWHLRAGEACLDPFAGSGTVLAAAEATGRVALAVEAEPAYVDTALARWQAATGQRPARGGELVDFGTAGG